MVSNRYRPFEPNPYVIYYHSTHNLVPLPYYVAKCEWTSSKPNKLGKPQYAVVSIELVLDEGSYVTQIEDAATFFLQFFGGNAKGISTLAKALRGDKQKGSPYRNKKLKFGF